MADVGLAVTRYDRKQRILQRLRDAEHEWQERNGFMEWVKLSRHTELDIYAEALVDLFDKTLLPEALEAEKEVA